ncbi:MAG: putative DNA-binding protein with PD1-like DNA-binding motif [Candidatus Methanohalarchaeum thermophilum]|uniref:DNA-binding protein with PD1-like DNA-binding motif n=1 Tax=Methanohalarchaeum thermophilum TaxID=1903181 RepID=A0A1Q6DS02_METT1|nr:MAG: putative DNA-binding protein with PD1-like DNA-binding motif [Candidatus Methanohalarchaeum thermophilum]
MKTKKSSGKIFVRLNRGEEVIAKMKELRKKYDIKNGFFHGIGAVDKLKLGNYNVENQNYREKEFKGAFEVSNFTGNIGPDKIHAHITVGDESYDTKTGHCSMARTSGTLEIIVHISDKPILQHKYDKETGLNIFDF